MQGLVEYLFGVASFVPHGYCLLWRPDLVALHAVSDVLIAVAYFSIPVAIVFFLRRRPVFEFSWLAVLFAAFILGCGLTHVIDLATLWWPIYGLQGLAKAGTAMVSVVTAAAIWPLMPSLLSLSSPGELQRANTALREEIDRRLVAEAELVRARDELELRVIERTRELAESHARLEAEVLERRRAEEAVRQGEASLQLTAESLRLAVEATALGIWDVDLPSEARQWSGEYKAILGLPPEAEASYALFTSLLHAEDREWVIERYRQAYLPDGNGRYQAEFRVLRASDGAERWVEVTGRVFFDASGQPRRAIGTLADVTARRRSIQALRESEGRYRALLDTGPDAVFVHRDGIVVLANQRAATLFGAASSSALIGRSAFSLVDDASLPLVRERTATLNRPGAHAELAELTYRRLDGIAIPVEATAAAVLIDGELVVQVVFRDITARKQLDDALRARTAELETVMETVPVAVWLVHDADARRITGNRYAARQLRLQGHDNHSLTAAGVERPCHFRVFKDGQAVPSEQLPLQRAARGELVRDEELRIVFDDGTFHDEIVNASPVRDARGAVVGAVGAAVDISERKAAEERVRHLALHDPLTGLPNRRFFQGRLEEALTRSRSEQARVAVMLLDLDNFKEVNDSLGHSSGDALLCEIAQRLVQLARSSDCCARLGGDEFAFLAEGLSGIDDAAAMAQRILGAFDGPIRIADHELDIGASLGFSLHPDDGQTAERIVRNADVALYRAKAAGRGRFEGYEPLMDQEPRANRALRRELRQALASDDLDLAYQPVFALPECRMYKVEALLRWNQPGVGPVSPALIIPVAEASGLIHPLGIWVLTAACRQAAAWRASGLPLKIAVNVSATQLRHSTFLEAVQTALQEAGLPPQALELELTEGVFLDASKEQIMDTLRRIAELGVTLAIDDFGTGYSSLAYLKHFPFDEVKIDASFVADIGRAPGSGAITAAIVELAHSLGKRVTAEGVETDAQLSFLRERGCDAAQGYLLGMPSPKEKVVGMLVKQRRGRNQARPAVFGI